MDFVDRFWGKLPPTGDPEVCWNWQGSLDSRSRYGQIMRDKKNMRAHRASYEFFVGPIPDGLLVLHKCDNPRCVNPAHLELGDQKKNMEDASKRGRLDKARKA